jgi:C1A family cysteine protease
MKAIFLLIVVMCSNVFSVPLRHQINDIILGKPLKEQFKLYHYYYDKTYDINSEYGLSKLKIYEQNVKFIKEKNAQNLGFKLGLGPFTDMTYEEFSKSILMPITQKEVQIEEFDFDLMADILDNEEKGNLEQDNYPDTPDHSHHYNVKNQGHECGSCWAFAISEAGSCSGGDARQALLFAATKGIAKASDYPYLGKNGTCKQVNSHTWANGFEVCESSRSPYCSQKKGIQHRNLQKWPYAAHIYSGPEFQNYESGLYDSEKCSWGMTNHVVNVVEYKNKVFKGVNSWGEKWGLEGKFYVAETKYTCGLTNSYFGTSGARLS